MPWNSVVLPPGVNQDLTPTANRAGFSQTQLVRFHDGLAQKNGGWELFYPVALASRPDEAHAWEDLSGTAHLAIGCTDNLVVITNGNLSDITPQTLTENVAVSVSTTNNGTTVQVNDTGRNATIYDIVYFNTQVSVGGIVLQGAYQIIEADGSDSYFITASTPATSTVSDGGAVPSFAVQSGSPTVTTTFDNHGLSVGQTAYFAASTTGGGVTIQGAYLVQTVPDANTFTFFVPNLASSTTSFSMNGGDMQLLYYIGIGAQIPGTGYGIGSYGEGGYGTGVVPPAAVGDLITASDWTLDNFGEDLVANPTGGPIYTWSTESGYRNAVPIVNAPFANNGIFTMMPEEQIMAWGSSTGGVIDPLLLRWCDAGDFTDWTALSTNLAGSYRLPTGSKIMGGLQANQQALLWTDIDLWSVQFIGYPDVYGFNKISSGCGLIGRHAAANMGAATFWMSQKQFFVYGASVAYGTEFGTSGVVPLQCPVWDVIFQNINPDYYNRVRCATNSQFNEVTWYYASIQSTEIDSYVRVSNPGAQNQAWDYGLLGRTAWIDQSVLGAPIGTSPSGYIYQHEMTNDAAGQAMLSSFTTGYWDIAEGEQTFFVDLIIPDFKFGFYNASPSATLQVSFNVVDYPGDTPSIYGPYPFTSATEFIPVRFRGRQMSMTVASSDLGSFWRIGRVRYRFAPDGRQ